MRYKKTDLVYSLNVEDIQDVASEVKNRPLTQKEIAIVVNALGGYIDWRQAVEHAILNMKLRSHA